MNSVADIETKPLPTPQRGQDSSSDVASASEFRVELCTDFDFLQRDYAELFAASDATAFQHPLWLHHLYDKLAPARQARMAVVTIRSTAGKLLGVLPLLLRRKTGVRLLEATDLGVSDYACPVLHPSLREHLESVPHLRSRIASVLPPHDIMRIRPIRQEHVAAWQAVLPGTAEALGFSAHATPFDAGYRQWRDESTAKSLRGRLSRAAKQIAKNGGAALRRLETRDEIEQAVAAIQSLRAGRFDGDPIQEDFVRDFYTNVAVAGAKDGLAAIYRLDIGGAPAGFVYGLCRRGIYHYLLIGCDYGTYSRCSPGLVLYDRIIEDWIGRDGHVFDFTIGDEPFKADFGTEATPMSGLFRAATWRGRMALAAFQAKERRKMARGPGDASGNGN